jgi:hypothetical protein
MRSFVLFAGGVHFGDAGEDAQDRVRVADVND